MVLWYSKLSPHLALRYLKLGTHLVLRYSELGPHPVLLYSKFGPYIVLQGSFGPPNLVQPFCSMAYLGHILRESGPSGPYTCHSILAGGVKCTEHSLLLPP